MEKEIVEEIVRDLSGRKGLGNEWDYIDTDIQEEIKQIWTDIISKHLDRIDI